MHVDEEANAIAAREFSKEVSDLPPLAGTSASAMIVE